jgi:hypothetical protein
MALRQSGRFLKLLRVTLSISGLEYVDASECKKAKTKEDGGSIYYGIETGSDDGENI